MRPRTNTAVKEVSGSSHPMRRSVSECPQSTLFMMPSNSAQPSMGAGRLLVIVALLVDDEDDGIWRCRP